MRLCGGKKKHEKTTTKKQKEKNVNPNNNKKKKTQHKYTSVCGKREGGECEWEQERMNEQKKKM